LGSLDWFFLRSLKKQKDTTETRIARERADSTDDTNLPELSIRGLALLRKEGRQTAAQLAEATGANRNTFKVRMRELVESERVKRFGKARATWYTL
jgi:Fic family protein